MTVNTVEESSRGEASALLSVEGLEVRFPIEGGRFVTAVDRVSFELGEGETLGLVGESGCGKSSLGRAVLQLVRPSAGSVRFLGQELTQLNGESLRSMRRHMQIVFQDPRGSLDPRMRIRDIVEEPLRAHRVAGRDERRKIAREMLAQVGLDESYELRRPAELSGGQQQRVGIARALVTHPKVVVCDEPVSSLDVSIQAQVINLLLDLKERLGVAYLFIAHNLAVVRHISNRIAVMYLGHIVEIAPANQLFARPLHPYTRGLLASVLPPHVESRAHLRTVQRLVLGDIPSLLDPPKGCPYHTRCPYAKDLCREVAPSLEQVDSSRRGERSVACHFYRETETTLT